MIVKVLMIMMMLIILTMIMVMIMMLSVPGLVFLVMVYSRDNQPISHTKKLAATTSKLKCPPCNQGPSSIRRGRSLGRLRRFLSTRSASTVPAGRTSESLPLTSHGQQRSGMA